jgi:hypothetical protein
LPSKVNPFQNIHTGRLKAPLSGGVFFSCSGGVAGFWLANVQRLADEWLNLSKQKQVNLAERYR